MASPWSECWWDSSATTTFGIFVAIGFAPLLAFAAVHAAAALWTWFAIRHDAKRA